MLTGLWFPRTLLLLTRKRKASKVNDLRMGMVNGDLGRSRSN